MHPAVKRYIEFRLQGNPWGASASQALYREDWEWWTATPGLRVLDWWNQCLARLKELGLEEED